jgi:hypothetical protein
VHAEAAVLEQPLDDDPPLGDEQPGALERRGIADQSIFRRKRQ